MFSYFTPEVLYPTWRRYLLALPVFLTILTSAGGSSARPATLFIPHLERIQTNLPSGLAMRLPSEVSIIGHSDIDESKLVVRIFPSQTPESFTLSLFTCERSAYPCLLGSFSVQRTTSVSAKRELDRHQAKGESLALVSDIQGYLLEGPSQNPPHQFTTLMWQQNDMIYTISFPASQGTSIQRMAISMAQGQLLYSNSRR